jgi:hypothetical protein
VLAVSSPATLYILARRLAEGRWTHTTFASAVGTLYAANDVVALWRVRLPPNTRVHHGCVLVLSAFNLVIDYNDESNVFSNITMLCGLSMLPFSVNAYLGLRKVTDARALAMFGLLTYVPVLALNVVWQTWAVGRAALDGQYAAAVCWGGLCGMIFFDDLILIDHLIDAVGARPRPRETRLRASGQVPPGGCASRASPPEAARCIDGAS